MSDRKETNEEFFATPFWSTSIPEWVDEIDKACQVHLDMAHEREKNKIEKNNGDDFGMVYHSGPIETDPKLKELVDYVGATAYNLLESWGNELSNHEMVYDSMCFHKMVVATIEYTYMKIVMCQVFIF